MVSQDASWADHGKHDSRMQAISMMMIFGLPFFWLTINPSDVNSPLVMHYGGHNIDHASTCHRQMPDYITRLKTVASDPVASATFFHETLQAVFDCILGVGAADGDGGVLGKVQACIGMTEEQFRLSLHAHLLVWVYGYNSHEQLTDNLGASLKKHVDLARRAVCSIAPIRPPFHRCICFYARVL